MLTSIRSLLGIKNLIGGIFGSIIISLIFAANPALAAGETYKWLPDKPVVQASGGIYSATGDIEKITTGTNAGKWKIKSNIKINFPGKPTCQVGEKAGISPLFDVDTTKNTISYTGSWDGSTQSGFSTCMQSMGSSGIPGGSISGKTSTTPEPPSMPTSCSSYSSTTDEYTACQQGKGFADAEQGDQTKALADCDTKLTNVTKNPSTVQACKTGVQLVTMPVLFADAREAACKDESGGTKTTCLSNFDKALEKCIGQSGADLNDVKVCMKKAYPRIAKEIDAVQTTTDETSSFSESTCKVEAIGWIICPVMNFMAKIVDQAYNFVSSLLVVQPLMTTGSSQPVYEAWKTTRNVANIAFVIAFLVVIYSQITNVGISNYGIKKMLPRIIVAAVLVNISYWICAIAVDLSNIIGGNVREFLSGADTTKDMFKNVTVEPGASATGEGLAGWVGLTAAVLIAGSAILYLGLSALLPALIAALVAIVTVFLVLTLRQALIILLVVISPLAFVAYLLPNTEQWFNKWRSLFQTLLLMFPIIAAIFGASALASTIVMNSASGDYKIAVQIMGALISILPLALTPVVMKAAGGVLNRFGGIVNNPNKGPFDRMRKGAEGIRKDRVNQMRERRIGRASKIMGSEKRALGAENSRRRKMAAFIGGAGVTHSIDQSQKRAFNEAAVKDSEQEYVAGRALKDDNYVARIAGDNERRQQAFKASSQASVDKVDSESIKSREILLRSQTDPRDMISVASTELEKAITSGDMVGARAYQNILLNSGSKGIETLADKLSTIETQSPQSLNGEIGESLRKDLNSAGLKGKDNALASWSYQAGTIAGFKGNKATYDALSDEELVGQSKGNLQAAVASGSISKQKAENILGNDNLKGKLSDDKRAVLEGITTTTSQPPVVNNITQNTTTNNTSNTTTSSQTTPNTSSPPSSPPSNFTQRESGLYVPRDHDNG